MKVLGLIVEYNPFHNGHLYHLEQSKKLSGADYTVCVMSGNFIQRGEPAIVNKWARAKMALLSGVDLVIELPFPYAMSSAEFFAYGAVKILDSIGIADVLCFGSENGSIHGLDQIAEVLCDEPRLYKALLKKYLDQGLSFPSARQNALLEYFRGSNSLPDGFEEMVRSSNNILGIEYLKALRRLKSTIQPLTIQRIGNTYLTEHLTGDISSATAIRKHILEGCNFPLEQVLPEPSVSIMQEEFNHGRGPVFASHFSDILLAALRKTEVGQLGGLPYVSEGLENRIQWSAKNSGSFEDLVEQIGSKRYTRTRIQRILFSFLNTLTALEFKEFQQYGGPQYIRVLGFNSKGRFLLSKIKRKTTLPLIVKPADFKDSCNPLLRKMVELEALSTDQYVLAYSNPTFKKAGQEYTQNVIRV